MAAGHFWEKGPDCKGDMACPQASISPGKPRVLSRRDSVSQSVVASVEIASRIPSQVAAEEQCAARTIHRSSTRVVHAIQGLLRPFVQAYTPKTNGYGRVWPGMAKLEDTFTSD